MPKSWALAAALAATIGCSFVASADVTIPDEYSKSIQEHSRIAALDGGFFGDHVGLATGSLEFVQTDVALPGNNALQVRVGRRFVVDGSAYQPDGLFGYWNIDIPNVHGVFAGGPYEVADWEGTGSGGTRCSHFGPPPESSYQGSDFLAEEYWHGTSVYLPGSGDQELLYAPAASGDVPNDGHSYPVVTRDGAAARCVPLSATSEAGSVGEGFEVVTPDGTVYTLNQMVSRVTDTLTKSYPGPPPSGGDGTVYRLRRREAFLYPTKVTDRFGNTVTYTWSSSNPWRLTSITASDGRSLTLTYSATDPDSRLVETVSDGTHTWTYAHYSGTGVTDTVTQPDGSTWQIAFSGLYSAHASSGGTTCDVVQYAAGGGSGTITAPSGAVAQYSVASKLFGRSQVSRVCLADPTTQVSIAEEPYLFTSLALTSKTITGPGLPANGLTWSYAYGPPNNCWIASTITGNAPDAVACPNNSPMTRTTTVTNPDGSVSRSTFGNTYKVDEGLLRTQEDGIVGSTSLRKTEFVYGDPLDPPYTVHNGLSARAVGDQDITGLKRPKASIMVTQQGKTFTWSVAGGCGSGPLCFDARARPTSVVRTGVNTPGGQTQAESIVYDDDTVHWILGQVAQRTIAGLVASSTTFDGNHMPWKVYAFGKLRNTFTFNTDGTIATVADGNGNVTTYASWKRGIPQSVHFPPTPEAASGATRTAVVNDNGWITSVTDENGYATGYAYDAMGRITQVTYPTGDSTTWNTTNSAFAPVASAENGVAAGHWKETAHTGNGYKVTLFDALWRPVLVREYDAGNVAATDQYVATAYDGGGRVADASYPLDGGGASLTLGGTAAATWTLGGTRPAGVRTSYDGLGRPTSVQQDSELVPSVLTTTTEYLTDFQRRVTDARGHATTEQFMAWDSPTFDWPVRIDAPENQRTTIARDMFGKPTAITRGEATP
jgi:YD repeat-containing protein